MYRMSITSFNALNFITSLWVGFTIDYRGALCAPGLETLNQFDLSVPRPQIVRLIGVNRY